MEQAANDICRAASPPTPWTVFVDGNWLTRVDIRNSLQQRLEQGTVELGASLSAEQLVTLVDYVVLLNRWNHSFNLTAVRDPLQMIDRHVLDSLSIRPFIVGHSLLDIGSGAGLPGLILAIAMPHLQVTLLDSALKRTRFLSHAVLDLGLANVSVVRTRLEAFATQSKFDTVTSRATIALRELLEPAMTLVQDGGRLVAMIGKLPEPAAAPWQDRYCLRIERLHVPGIEGDRHAVLVEAASRREQLVAPRE